MLCNFLSMKCEYDRLNKSIQYSIRINMDRIINIINNIKCFNETMQTTNLLSEAVFMTLKKVNKLKVLMEHHKFCTYINNI